MPSVRNCASTLYKIHRAPLRGLSEAEATNVESIAAAHQKSTVVNY